MITIRKYKRLGWFDLLDRLEEELEKKSTKEVYFEFLDEYRMRVIDSVSEGATFKISKEASSLVERFKKEVEVNESFATQEELAEFIEISKDVTR